MIDMALSVLFLTALVTACVVLLAIAHRRWAPDTDTLIAAIDALLPQTQCAQCGYAGCRPYAEAIAAGASIDLCPPGGADTQQQLAQLLRRDIQTPLAPMLNSPVARIDETACIGCFLCVKACPVDAIIGAPQTMHTVIIDDCTGCELCVEPCPVDCIVLVNRES